MAKLERLLTGNFDRILERIEKGVLDASISATLEESSDFYCGPKNRCSVRVFERYSYMGGNRVSMSVTLFQFENNIHLSAITSGGSQAVFFKLNTFGEEAFLETLESVLR